MAVSKWPSGRAVRTFGWTYGCDVTFGAMMTTNSAIARAAPDVMAVGGRERYDKHMVNTVNYLYLR